MPDESFGYLYDDSGNRTSSTEDGVTRAYTANNLNQYTAITNPAVSPAHDGDGNMTSDGEWLDCPVAPENRQLRSSAGIFRRMLDLHTRVCASRIHPESASPLSRIWLVSLAPGQYTRNADNRLVAIENATHREEYDYDYFVRWYFAVK